MIISTAGLNEAPVLSASLAENSRTSPLRGSPLVEQLQVFDTNPVDGDGALLPSFYPGLDRAPLGTPRSCCPQILYGFSA